MDKLIYFNKLFELYEKLFTENQRSIFKLYYEEDLSFQEIAEIKNVSRSFIGKTINQVEEKLEEYERSLKKLKIKESLEQTLKKNKEDLKKEIEKILDNYY